MKRSFTLIEPMVVIAIIGILGVVITPVVGKAIQKANAAKIIAIARNLELACQQYHLDTNEYAREWTGPGYVAAFHTRLFKDPGVVGWDGPYIKKPLAYSDSPYNNHIHLYGLMTFSANPTLLTGGNGFDLDGDGTPETLGSGNVIVISYVPLAVRTRVNDLIDGPNEGTGNEWQGRGQVEYRALAYNIPDNVCIYLGGD